MHFVVCRTFSCLRAFCECFIDSVSLLIAGEFFFSRPYRYINIKQRFIGIMYIYFERQRVHNKSLTNANVTLSSPGAASPRVSKDEEEQWEHQLLLHFILFLELNSSLTLFVHFLYLLIR